MDRAMENLLVRLFGSFALAATLVHAGLDVPARAWPALYLAPFFVGAVAANWALARLNAKRAALWATALLLGALPLGMPLGHLARLPEGGVYAGVLYAGAAFGLATLALALVMLSRRVTPE